MCNSLVCQLVIKHIHLHQHANPVYTLYFCCFLRLSLHFLIVQKSQASLSSTFCCMWKLPVFSRDRYTSKSFSHFGSKRSHRYAYCFLRGKKWRVSSSTWQFNGTWDKQKILCLYLSVLQIPLPINSGLNIIILCSKSLVVECYTNFWK